MPVRLLLKALLCCTLLHLCLPLGPAALAAKPYKVLLIFSYGPDYLWEQEIKAAVEQVLGDEAELTLFYMNTKRELAKGPEKAKEALALFNSLRPDGVIAADDAAQSMFVVPYLKNRVATPVVFCGVNADPEDYGYPARNVSGILERFHIEESLAFNRQLTGKTDRFAVMVNESPVADLVARQLRRERETLSAELIALLRPTTLEAAITQARDVRDKVDMLMLVTLNGIVDAAGKPVNDHDAIKAVVDSFGKPTVATAAFAIKSGALSGVLATGREQGFLAANMLLQAMQGTSLADLPMRRNYYGKRILNVTALKHLGLKPQPIALRGVELVRSE